MFSEQENRQGKYASQPNDVNHNRNSNNYNSNNNNDKNGNVVVYEEPSVNSNSNNDGNAYVNQGAEVYDTYM